MKFKKIIFYGLESGPIESEFIKNLEKMAKVVKIILGKGEYLRFLRKSDLKDADAFITRLFDYYDNCLFKNSNLKYIGAMHTDVSHFDKKFLNKKRIVLTNVPGCATEAVAELTISALLNISRQTHDAMNFVKEKNWGFEKFLSWELKGKTLGVIGLGKIGVRVAEIAQGLGMNVIYYSKNKKKVSYKFVELNKLIKQSDVITLHCDLTNKTEHILNKSNLNLMKTGAVLLNSARMELVDLDVVYKFCKQKKIFAWFDELQDATWRDKFRKLANVYLTPDYGWMTGEAQQKVREITLDNIKAFLNGNPKNKVN